MSVTDDKKSKLIDTLLYNTLTGHETAEALKNLKTYYSLLTLSELENKLNALSHVYEKHNVQVSKLEMDRRERLIDSYKYKRPVELIMSKVPDVKRPLAPQKDEEVCCILMRKDWIKNAVVIAPNVIGVKLTDNKYRKRVTVICARERYVGEVIYG